MSLHSVCYPGTQGNISISIPITHPNKPFGHYIKDLSDHTMILQDKGVTMRDQEGRTLLTPDLLFESCLFTVEPFAYVPETLFFLPGNSQRLLPVVAYYYNALEKLYGSVCFDDGFPVSFPINPEISLQQVYRYRPYDEVSFSRTPVPFFRNVPCYLKLSSIVVSDIF